MNKLVILIFALSFCGYFGANGKKMLKLIEVQQDSKKADHDVLHPTNCHNFRAKELCKKSHYVRNKLCKETCRCDDVLSRQSCLTLKKENQCSLVHKYCKWTCGCHKTCVVTALGMQSGAIRDSRLRASSIYDSNHRQQLGRLHRSGTNWSARHRRAGEWIQADLSKVTTVLGVATQGRQNTNQWVKSYTLKYSNDGKTFHDYLRGKVFSANNDRNTVVKHILFPPITARFVRIVVKTWYSWPSMRMELYGCK